MAYHEKLFTQNVTNITFIFKTSPNAKPKEKKVGGHGNVPCVPHQIAPMIVCNPVMPQASMPCSLLHSVMSVFTDLRSAECVCSYYGLRVCS